jgi:hypothetical protein
MGPVTLAQPWLVEIDLAPIAEALGTEVRGVCGFDLFRACVVELDLEAPSLRLWDPASFDLETGGWQELILHGRLLCVRARFEGRTGLFRLDTGAGKGTVLFHSPAVHKLGLLDGREVEDGSSVEAMGTMRYKIGRLANFELGGRRFDAPVAGFSIDETGAMADSATTGTIAREFLTPFRLVFDVSRQRIAFIERTTPAARAQKPDRLR